MLIVELGDPALAVSEIEKVIEAAQRVVNAAGALKMYFSAEFTLTPHAEAAVWSELAGAQAASQASIDAAFDVRRAFNLPGLSAASQEP